MIYYSGRKQDTFRYGLLLWFSSLLFVVLFSLKSLAEMTLPPPADVRVLIDISGSMKKNDPNNLRRPALNLITELLPAGDTAGVWTFGQYVNELVNHQPVDDSWRKMAKEKAQEINSVALFTNIGAALEKASEDLQAGGDYSNTHFILLTDGVVDISQTSTDNVKERERLQTQVAKRFKQLKAKIHTIALSKNADQVILKKLSVATDGVAALAETSEQLSRVFLQAFERASPSEEVPIEGNKFDVDSSVEEFTALIFRSNEATTTGLIEPTGKQFTARDHPSYVNWFEQPGYDLITVKQPLEGEWKLEADLAEGSKVTVVSNLKLVFDPLPGNFYAGDQLAIRAGFFEDGQPVVNPTFLDLVRMDVTITTEDNKSGTKTMSKPGEPPADGVFREKITRLKKVGRYQVIVQADGRTFKRQARQLIQLNPPLGAELEATGTGADTHYRVIVSALSPNINTIETSLVSKVRAPDGGNIIKSVPYNDENGRWELDVEPTRGEGIYEVTIRVDGVTLSGNQFRFEPDVINAEFPRQEASPNQFVSLIDEAQAAGMNDILANEIDRQTAGPSAEGVATDAGAQEPASADEQPEESEGLDPVLIAAIGGGIITLLLLGGLGFWLFRRKKAEDDLIEERTSRKDDVPVSAEPPAEPDLEDEIDMLEQTPEIEEDPDDMEFALEEPDFGDDLDIPDIDPAPEPLLTGKPEPDSAPEGTPLSEEALLPEKTPLPGKADTSEAEPVPEAEATPEPDFEEDDDEEFNLEDFDISDTDDLPSADNDDK